MKQFLGVILVAVMAMVGTSCTTVAPGHKGVEVSWGGETNLAVVYPEGISYGIHWLFDEMVPYDVREHTMVETFEFNDKNDMKVTVVMALDYNLSPLEVNLVHSKINDIMIKIQTSLSSAAKIVVPQFGAVDLNKHGRSTAETMLDSLLKDELPEFYVEYKRVRITDVNIPDGISQLAEQTAVQIGKNELAEKMEAEQASLAKAKVAKAQGNFDAGVLDAKTKKLLSTPEILKLKELDVEMMWAEKGVSRYGNNNMFGVEGASVIKGLK